MSSVLPNGGEDIMRYDRPCAVQCSWIVRSPSRLPCLGLRPWDREEILIPPQGGRVLRAARHAAIVLMLLCSPVTLAHASENVAGGQNIFQRCASCHVVTGSDPMRKGPSLQGIVGRPIASIPGFDYSPNMATLGAQGRIWDEKTLDEFLKYPSEFVKGTKMTAPPVRREGERAELIAYLRTLK